MPLKAAAAALNAAETDLAAGPVAAQNADAPVAVVQQEVYGGFGSRGVVGGDAGEVGVVKFLRRIGQQGAGDSDGVEILPEKKLKWVFVQKRAGRRAERMQGLAGFTR